MCIRDRPESVINVGVSGPGVVRCALKKIPDGNLTDVADTIKKTAFKITRQMCIRDRYSTLVPQSQAIRKGALTHHLPKIGRQQ